MKQKIIRTATVAMSLDILLKGQLQFLSKHYHVVAVSGGIETLNNLKEREQVEVISIEMQRKIAPLNDLWSLWNLYRCFKKEKPSIVHSITPKAGLLSMIAAYVAGVPVRMHTFTGLIFPSKNGVLRYLLILMDKLVCVFATHIIPEGEGVKNVLLKHNITKKPLKVIANGNVNGVDTSYFNPDLFSKAANLNLRATLGINENDKVFVFIGRLVGDKGINELVEAFVELQLEVGSRELGVSGSKFQVSGSTFQVSGSTFQVSGSTFHVSSSKNTENQKPETRNNKLETCKLLLVGPFESELDPLKPSTVKEIAENPHIISVGYQEDVRPYLAISNVLVFPSYREGFPNVVLQAGAMGLPSIVSNISGCNEIIEEGKNGWIVPVKAIDPLTNAMQNCLQTNETNKAMGHNARTNVIEKFEQQLVWNALLETYTHALNSKQ